jgi:hypothetical protein
MNSNLISSISCPSFIFSDLNLFLDNPTALPQEVTQITLIIVIYWEEAKTFRVKVGPVYIVT